MKKNLLKLHSDINDIFIEWNPIGVDSRIATDEYRVYVPQLIRNLERGDDLMKYLEHIVTYNMGLEYNPNNKQHFEDLYKISKLMLEAFSK